MPTANHKGTYEVVFHKDYPFHPRILRVDGEKNVLAWPCGNSEHPLHASQNFIVKNYTSRTPLSVENLSEGLQKAMKQATEAQNKEEALVVLLPFQEEITGICTKTKRRGNFLRHSIA